ncbi:MAG: 50S ribosomal protein L15 [Candidatus Magasanikbacteria bacterium]|nr:50S ribosomal protein L15 [Candidatus Magasanikbacteria bacterium]
MAIELHKIKSSRKSSRTKKRVGRGNATGKGTYSGRGLKGQRSRAGGKGGLKRIGMKANLQKIPKVRGFKSIHPKKETVSLSTLEKFADKMEIVTPESLKKLKIIAKARNGVKIVSNGELTKKIAVKGCGVSAKAREAIEKAGGSIE